MAKFIRTTKGFINSDYIIRIEMKGDDMTVHFREAAGESTAEVKGAEDVRAVKTILELPVPRADGYIGDALLEYPEGSDKG